ncbi:transporter substrate-binding domain-containing protein [Paulownia witches'-broom phytoplasma]|uniref:Transporter substrate-binding domain-containing protein n=1 Tax=Paulownia witches'-broom phytoplasma TaxID=39647 RepID=A0ABX8TQ08_9MOLU|nr:transporter substrate-binding domain-containing protein [Paulownia witches'-broom phytoplasma]QYC30868.1 transporter substrate-binding domain-containing protein [Paulownia witches'-broom phytoplasma]GLH60479.1 glutamine ABC transporter substrate-binding protein [Paulownia witches'-broom phytoplasma]
MIQRKKEKYKITEYLKYTKYVLLFMFMIFWVWLHFSVGLFQRVNNSKKYLRVAVVADAAPNSLTIKSDKDTSKAHRTIQGEYISGFDIDLIDKIVKALPQEEKYEGCKFSLFDFDGMFTAVQNGSVDVAISSISITEKRKENFDFPIAYTLDNTGFLVRKDDARFKDLLKEVKYEDIKGILKDSKDPIKFLTLTGSVADKVIENIRSDLGNLLHITKSNPIDDAVMCAQSVKDKASDIFVTDSYITKYYASQNDELKHISIISDDARFTVSPTGLGIVVKKGNTKLIIPINNAFKEVLKKEELVLEGYGLDVKDIIELTKELKEEQSKPTDKQDLKRIKTLEDKISKFKEITNKWLEQSLKELSQKQGLNWYQKVSLVLPDYATPLKTTLLLALDGVIVGFILAIVLTGIKSIKPNYQTQNPFIVGLIQSFLYLLDAILYIFKSIPVAAQMIIVHFGWRAYNPELNPMYSGIIVLLLNSAVSITNILLQNIKFLDKGQVEASLALGMTQRQTFFCVIFPQTLKRSLPFVVQQFIVNIKDSACFGGLVGLLDVAWKAKTQIVQTGSIAMPYAITACIYLVLITIANLFVKYLEKQKKGV